MSKNYLNRVTRLADLASYKSSIGLSGCEGYVIAVGGKN